MTDTDEEIPVAFRCMYCEGDGWYIGHDPACYESGDCNCSGVQIHCVSCEGTGRADA